MAEKQGDHWELKDRKGPSDPQSKQSGRRARDAPKETFGGVDAEGNSSRSSTSGPGARACAGRSRMTKAELAQAVARKQG